MAGKYTQIMEPNAPQAMTLYELAQQTLRATPEQIMDLLDEGHIPHFMMMGEVRMLASDVQRFIEAGVSKQANLSAADVLMSNQVWCNQIEQDPSLRAQIEDLKGCVPGSFSAILKRAAGDSKGRPGAAK